MGLGVSRRAEHWAVRAWLRDLSRCAALGVYSTAETAADLIKEERTQPESASR